MLDKLAKVGTIVIAAGAVVGALGWWLSREPKREMGAAVLALSEKVSAEFAASIPVERELNDVLFLIVQRQSRDEEEQFRKIVTRDIKDKAKYRIKSWEDVLSKLKGLGALLREAGFVSDEAPDSFEDARKAIRLISASNVKLDGVLLVRVTDFEQGDHGLGAKVTLEGELHDLKSGKKVDLPPRSDSITSSVDYRYLSNRLNEMSFFGRFVVWFLASALLPFLLKAPISALTRKRKNELNLVILVGLTLASVVAGWFLIVAMGYGWGSIFVLVVLAALMGYYNHDAVEYIDQRLS